MAIWKVPPSRAALRFKPRSTLVDHLDIRIDEAGDDYLKGSMPVDQRTQQSMGFLHGGASVALAETLGSIAANFCVDPSTHAAVGLQINANHVRTVRSGGLRVRPGPCIWAAAPRYGPSPSRTNRAEPSAWLL